MCRSVFAAGRHRLAHLGLARPSKYSRRFARIHTLWLSVAIALAVFTNAGWHAVPAGPAVKPAAKSPTGAGWRLVIENPEAISFSHEHTIIARVWWNARLAFLAAAIGWLASLVGMSLFIAIIGSKRAPTGQEGQHAAPTLRCAVHYSTAWMVFFLFGAIVLIFRPLSLLAATGEWSIVPPSALFDTAAVVLFVAGALLWWFWLIRMGAAGPQVSRAAVTRFYVFWTPVIAIVITVSLLWVAWYSLHAIMDKLGLAW